MSALNRILDKLQNRLRPSVTIATANTEVDYTLARQGGVIVTNKGASGAVVFALPPATVGAKVTAVVLAAQALRLDPHLTETVALPTGVQQAAGKYIGNSTIGSTITLVCITPGSWDVTGSAGTWAAEA